ncbi:MAG: helix-turn-helix domain-containing protein, partial [Pseudonocardiaceae bacterium]
MSATLAGITVRYLEMIEAGTKTPSLPTLKKIGKVLGVRVAALVGGAPSEDYEGPVNPRLAAIERALLPIALFLSVTVRFRPSCRTW